MRVPSATYRLQLTPDFGFDAARRIVPYLDDLGIGDLYLSPIFEARPGSTHGYDVTDPTRVRAELGGEEGLEALAAEARGRGMGLLLDIVPNHLALGPHNPWWWDVLTHGQASTWARFFDVDWERHAEPARGKVVLPILGRRYAEALAAGELAVELRPTGLVASTFDHELPVDPAAVPGVLALGGEAPGLEEAVRLLGSLPPRSATSEDARATRAGRARAGLDLLRRACATEGPVREVVERALKALHEPDPATGLRARLDALLADQAWWLVGWRNAASEINYRRFFAINDLIGVRVEDPAVFDATHALIARLLREGVATGVRVDHIDGLRDPRQYLERLQTLAPDPGEGLYVVVEKILGPGERLPGDWPVAGTTGYDFLGATSGLFVDPDGLRALERHYAAVTGHERFFEGVAVRRKRALAEELFAGDLDALSDLLVPLARREARGRDLNHAEVRRALVEMTACLPVYRTYVSGAPVDPRDRNVLRSAAAEARRRAGNEVAPGAVEVVESVLALEGGEEALPLVLRWQQLSGAIMAKGVEDTAFYVHNPLISLNEVGAEPGEGTTDADAFHAWCVERAAHWPGALSATSTHDTKRSQDVRARIHVLAERAAEWTERVDRWREWNQEARVTVDDEPVPSPNREISLYQTLVGAWPLDPAEVPAFRERLKEYIPKAVREAKTHSTWEAPDDRYEAGVLAFVEQVLAGAEASPFLDDFLAFQREVARDGAQGSLALVLLKIAAPGVPDVYQGNESWNLSLVDPDNRRPVDHERLARLLAETRTVGQSGPPPPHLLKLLVTARALAARRARPLLFGRGSHLPLTPVGEAAGGLLAFARRLAGDGGGEWALAAVPLRGSFTAWGDTAVPLPPEAPDRWEDALTGREVSVVRAGGDRILRAGALFGDLPAALLLA